MNKALVKATPKKPRLPKRASTSIAGTTTYRVSKAQSLRMRAFDERTDAAEAKKAIRNVAEETFAERLRPSHKPATLLDLSVLAALS